MALPNELVKTGQTEDSDKNELMLWDSDSLPLSSELKMQLGANITMLQDTIGRTPSGLPTCLIDPVALFMASEVKDDCLVEIAEIPQKAMFHIAYNEGFATIDGIPIWERLPKETNDAYKLYVNYRDQRKANGNRSFQWVSRHTNASLTDVITLASLNHWIDRNVAFDAFHDILDDIRRDRDMQQMSRKHISAARDIFTMCTNFIGDEKNRKMLTPKVALGWAEFAVKLERLSLGLHPDKPESACGNDAPMIQINNQQNNMHNVHNGPSSTNHRSEEMAQMTDVLKILAKSGVLGSLQTTEEITGEIVDIDTDLEDLNLPVSTVQ